MYLTGLNWNSPYIPTATSSAIYMLRKTDKSLRPPLGLGSMDAPLAPRNPNHRLRGQHNNATCTNQHRTAKDATFRVPYVCVVYITKSAVGHRFYFTNSGKHRIARARYNFTYLFFDQSTEQILLFHPFVAPLARCRFTRATPYCFSISKLF